MIVHIVVVEWDNKIDQTTDILIILINLLKCDLLCCYVDGSSTSIL
jgi:hypothetical protein